MSTTSIYNPLAPLLRREGTRTRRARRPGILSEHQIAPWVGLPQEIRRLAVSKLGEPSGVAPPRRPEEYIVATEAGVSARIIGNALDEIGRVFAKEKVHVRFADRATGSHAVPGDDPDGMVQGTMADGTCRIVAEFKTPWTTNLGKFTSKKRRQLLDALMDSGWAKAQIAAYMNAYSCRFGFVSTYDQTILIKRAGKYRFLVSDVFEASQVSAGTVEAPQISTREALWYLAMQARYSVDWKWTWRPADRAALINGSFNLGHDIRERKRRR
ncbi:hypothetical protein BO82DRAFT_398809 [Aspergillus uvarum CBS 121591]|uniref:Uncharacterized protein n=1 Tax=Aspergillus uvarum CBS 121591 TaxID=1448315 RepID=A0A319CI84_9EURO|nr:hypothetical protein BO82DRAFT_398809 [Aspergillus uvarum CBS 121591]PYH85385.1 hypothetical protein BO82DRAFT_398809 [Aspergillus uvarum CBS 121591]